ncbi:hypothetical protein DV736_g5337, partial [Chaetothyriales sp. CBS 134916]
MADTAAAAPASAAPARVAPATAAPATAAPATAAPATAAPATAAPATAAAATDTSAAAVAAGGRPQKPDEAKYKADLAAAEKAHEAAQKKFQDARGKFDAARGGSGPNASGNDRFSELVAEQKDIRKKQGDHKAAKAGQLDKFNRNDAEVKKLLQEQKEARARAGFKSADEVDQRIEQIMKQVDSGSMKLVDEKKALADVSSLRRQKKSLASLDDLQKRIDAKKADNGELKKTIESAESRALSQKFEDNQKEIDEIKAGREASKSNLDALRADRDRLHAEQQLTWLSIKKIKDEYFAARKAVREYEDVIWQQRREKKAAEDAAWRKEKRHKAAEQRLEEASEPAFGDEIRTAEGLIKHFDPSYGAAEDDKGPGEYAATAQRTIDDSGFKGMKVIKKDVEDFFVGGGGKKKKAKKATAAGPTDTGKLNMNVGVIEELSKVGIDPPATQADIPAVVDKLKAKLGDWKKNQKEQTEKNVAKAKTEIERLEKEADEAPISPVPKGRRQDRSKKAAPKSNGTYGDALAENEHAHDKDAVDDVTTHLKATKVDSTNGEAEATATPAAANAPDA